MQEMSEEVRSGGHFELAVAIDCCLINKKVMEKGDMVSNDSKSFFQMRKPNVWPLQEIVGLSVGDGSQSSVLIKDEADE